MKTLDYTATITANTTAKDAFENISRVPEWWGTDFEGSSKNPDAPGEMTGRFIASTSK
jgi:hypothetical protein